MPKDTIELIIKLAFISFFIVLMLLSLYLGAKIPLNHELKKIDKLKSNNNVKSKPSSKEKIKTQLITSAILILTVLIICIICKIFGFSAKDIANMF